MGFSLVPRNISLLQSRKESFRFQILAEIAARQPDLLQKELAERLNLTPPAISEYIKGLLADGLVSSDGRMRYSITAKGLERLRDGADELRRYSSVVMKEVITSVPVWTALAEIDLMQGERVSLEMKNGLLYANRKEGMDATGTTISDATEGEDIGVRNLKGLISLDQGRIAVCKVPRIQIGGSRNVNRVLLESKIRGDEMIYALGIESLIVLRKVGIEADAIFGAKEAIVEASCHGVPSLIVCVNEQVPAVMDRLDLEGLKYELVDLTFD